jgi:hypothetical protein
MTRNIVPMFVLACGVVAFAQTPPPQQPSKDMKRDTITVTGCVAEGASGTFMLNNAMMSHDMKSRESTSGTTPPPTPSTPSTSSMTSSYTLVGGENLKVHVGHKVEVTGTMSQSGSGSSTTGSAGTTGTAGSSGMKAQELRVQSVKMVSATCP